MGKMLWENIIKSKDGPLNSRAPLFVLRINGSYELPNVWTKRSVADNLKPSNRKAKLKLLQEPQLGVHNV
ncbi:hypothetical protein NC652_037725 [Populus alba x Populus x berolinensis]|nr:hypothetical protein NC652_037725 [Populus alba x Populus x berolinensis]